MLASVARSVILLYMSQYLFEQYMDLAIKKAPELPEDDAARAVFMLGLELPEVEAGYDNWVVARLIGEGAAILGGLQAEDVPPDAEITPLPPGSRSLRNDPIKGWSIAELAFPPYYKLNGEKQKRDPRPVMLDPEGNLRVYNRLPVPGTSIDGYDQYRYVYGTSSPANNAAILMGYALRVVQHGLEPSVAV